MQTPSQTAPKNAGIVADLQARGLIFQSTNPEELTQHLSSSRTLYCGFDPTADSLHIGSLVPLLTLKRFQSYGHRPVVLVGGSTGMIGDPSFKAQERKLNTVETVKNWAEKLKAQTSRFVSFEGSNAALMANNYDWTSPVSVLDFLRDIGKHFSVNAMISKEAVKSRLEREDSGISFTEFSYALLQAYDFLCLYEDPTYQCTLQIGGSDQWGNITAGTELIRKKAGGQAYALTLPLVTKADGTKFGKTETGTIWLDAAKTSPYAFYQFWLNTADADVEKFLLYFSFRPVKDIDVLIAAHRENPSERLAQKALARDITELVHGQEALFAAERISAALFGDFAKQALSETDFAMMAQDGLPTFVIGTHTKVWGLEDTVDEDSWVPTILDGLLKAGLASSKREARDFLKGNAVLHNGAPVSDEAFTLTPGNAAYGQYHLLRRGKKNYALLVHA